MLDGLDGVAAGDELIVLTWLDRARRNVLRVSDLEALDGTPVVDLETVLR